MMPEAEGQRLHTLPAPIGIVNSSDGLAKLGRWLFHHEHPKASQTVARCAIMMS
jgi:hypothetical protein